MAIFPEPREDLLVEATAMPRRGEFRLAGSEAICFIGFRPDEAASIYFGDGPVLHFNAQRQLRRLFFDDQQFVAQQGRLVRRRRSGPGGRVTNTDTDLSEAEASQLMTALSGRWDALAEAVRCQKLIWLRTMVAADLLRTPLEKLLEANQPNIFVADDSRL